MRLVTIGNIQVSALCLGGNPFSGFSHQNAERNREMMDYYSVTRIKETLRKAEEAGVNTVMARADRHIRRLIREYRNEGGAIQWIAQTPSEYGDQFQAIRVAAQDGAVGIYPHGGIVDFWYAQKQYADLHKALEIMRGLGVAAGFAGHAPDAHAWIRDNLDVDFQMCCHYNPTDRTKRPDHSNVGEKWDDRDRQKMLEVIDTIEKPVIHYKVFAGGNKPIVPALDSLGKAMKPNHAVCVGVFLKDDPDMITKDVALFEKHVEGRAEPDRGSSANRR